MKDTNILIENACFMLFTEYFVKKRSPEQTAEQLYISLKKQQINIYHYIVRTSNFEIYNCRAVCLFIIDQQHQLPYLSISSMVLVLSQLLHGFQRQILSQ